MPSIRALTSTSAGEPGAFLAGLCGIVPRAGFAYGAELAALEVQIGIVTHIGACCDQSQAVE